MSTKALSPDAQRALIDEARERAAMFGGSVINGALQSGRRGSYENWMHPSPSIVFEQAGVGVITQVYGEQMRVAVVVASANCTEYVSESSVGRRTRTRLCCISRADADSVAAHIERATAVAVQLVRLRLGGWDLRGRESYSGVNVCSPIVDGTRNEDSEVHIPYKVSRLRHWTSSKSATSPTRMLRRLVALPTTPGTDGKSAKDASEAAKRAAVEAKREAAAAERERLLVERAAAAAATAREAATEALVTDTVIGASPELSAAQTVAVIERVHEQLGERPSAAMIAVISEEVRAAMAAEAANA